MDKVTVTTKNPYYNGDIFGYSFYNGEAKDVPLSHAEFMVKQFNVQIKQTPKPKAKPRTTRKSTAKTPAKKAD